MIISYPVPTVNANAHNEYRKPKPKVKNGRHQMMICTNDYKMLRRKGDSYPSF